MSGRAIGQLILTVGLMRLSCKPVFQPLNAGFSICILRTSANTSAEFKFASLTTNTCMFLGHISKISTVGLNLRY